MFSRRDFLRISGMASAAALVNWQCPALAQGGRVGEGEYDAIIIGAGLGGLSCASLLARNGLRPLVIDKRDVPGGYATSFIRNTEKGNFICEASLHGLTGSPLGAMLLEQLGLKDKLTFVPHDFTWSSLYPDFAFDSPQPWSAGGGLVNAYSALAQWFPEEEGLAGYMNCWQNLLVDIEKFYNPEGGGLPDDLSQFPYEYPTWASMLWKKKKEKIKTLAHLMKEYKIKDKRLKAILGQSWFYTGLPPAEIPAWLYLMQTGLFHSYGSFYIQGTSQSLSNALLENITDANVGGEVLLNTEVTEIIIDNGRAVGVKTKNRGEYYANAVVSNAAVPHTFGGLIPASEVPADYMEALSLCRPGTSHFNVWLGVDLDLDNNDGFKESYNNLHSNTAVYPSYKHERAYRATLQCNPEKSGFSLLCYDKIIDGFSPESCGSITLTILSDYEPWEKFETVYRELYSFDVEGKGNVKEDVTKEDYDEKKERITEKLIGGLAEKFEAVYGGLSYFSDIKDKVKDDVTIEDYYKEKEQITEKLIGLAEEYLLPGLSDRIIMKESSTPLTNVRYTYNTQGAIYGYDQTEGNSALSRLGNRTPIAGLYLASAWSNPGGGFELVMLSGKEAFKCMLEDWGLV